MVLLTTANPPNIRRIPLRDSFPPHPWSWSNSSSPMIRRSFPTTHLWCQHTPSHSIRLPRRRLPFYLTLPMWNNPALVTDFLRIVISIVVRSSVFPFSISSLRASWSGSWVSWSNPDTDLEIALTFYLKIAMLMTKGRDQQLTQFDECIFPRAVFGVGKIYLPASQFWIVWTLSIPTNELAFPCNDFLFHTPSHSYLNSDEYEK